MEKKLSKKKIIILAIITVALIIGAVVAILFVKWNNYYNKIWTPLTTIAYNTECDAYPYSYCGMCRNNPDMPMIHKNREHIDYYFELPEKLKYDGAAGYFYCPPFDNSIKGPQYDLNIEAIIGKDFSDIKWEIDICGWKSSSYGYVAYQAVIDPDTLEVLEIIYKEDSDIDYMKECEGMIRDGISNLRSVFSPYLG